jgi:hypothetical protein
MPKTKGSFVCKDCGRDFATSREFSDHFKRRGGDRAFDPDLGRGVGQPGSIQILGCKTRAEIKDELSRAKSAP